MTLEELDRLYLEAIAAQDDGDYAKSFPLLLRGADAGDHNAQNALGLAYDSGYGVEADKAAAIRWFKKAWRTQQESMYSNNLALTYAQIGQRRRAHYWWKLTFSLGEDAGHGLWFAKFLLQSKGPIDYKRIIPLVEKAANAEFHLEICENDQEEAQALLEKLRKQVTKT
ncbi:sel1 repeat family protein [bacterium]|nr:MAG: sel1 repeat family protein [bacterium]